MTDINPAASAARELARHSSGRFGAQPQTPPDITLGPPSLPEARRIMSQLDPGASVIVTLDGKDIPCIVQRRDAGFGHPDSKNVTVGYGPGRWNQEINAAGIAAGNYGVRPETNIERLRREAGITDPTHPDYNSDLDIIVPAITKSYRQLINDGIDPNDEAAVEAYVHRELGLDTTPMEERSPDELVTTMRAAGIPEGATVLFEETDQGGRWLTPIALRLTDGTRMGAADAEDTGVDWDELEWAASNIRGSAHPDLVETDRHSGTWELPPATN